MSDAIQAVYKKFNISKRALTSYHPSSHGVMERANWHYHKCFKTSKTDYLWDKYLHLALLAY